MIDRRPREFTPEQVALLTLMADLVMRELELRQRSMQCPVTGLTIRSAFFQFGEQEVVRARRQGSPLSLFNFDIDDFRQINNRWGHQAGDQVLLDVCRVARAPLRPDDLFGRIGDEEFSILLVESDLSRALQVAEQVRAQIAALRGVFDHSDYQPRISGGITSLSPATTVLPICFTGPIRRSIWPRATAAIRSPRWWPGNGTPTGRDCQRGEIAALTPPAPPPVRRWWRRLSWRC